MGTGYSRNDTPNNIADSNIINASDLDGEFDAIVASFSAATGHTHDGTPEEGGVVSAVGPAQDLVVSITGVTPKVSNTLDLGKVLFPFKDLFLQGTASIGNISLTTTNPSILGGDTNGVFSIGPSTTSILGGNILLYGETHTTKANDIEFRSGPSVEMHYDNSTAKWDFLTNGLSTSGAITFSGGGSLTGSWTDLGTVATMALSGGSVNGTTIGLTTPSTGSFTTLSVSGSVSLLGSSDVIDSLFTIKDNLDTSKKIQFQLSGITTGTTRTLTVPDISDELVTLTAVQTLTNKTITNPTLDLSTVTSTGDVPVSDGGTGASTAIAARTNLGLAIGTDIQTYDATLGSLSSLGTTADRIAYTTGLDTWAETPLSLFGRTLIDDVNAAASRTTLGLGSIAVLPSPSGAVVGTTDVQTLTSKTIDAGSNTLTNLTTGVFATNVVDVDSTLSSNSDLRIPSQKASKAYIDNLITGLKWKESVAIASTTNLVLSGEQTIDGVLTSLNRVLVKDQTIGSTNGIYLTSVGAWVRALGADTSLEITGSTVFVEQGVANADTQWTMTTDSVVLGTTSLVYAQVSGAGTYSSGNGLQLTSNQFAIDTTITADLLTVQSLANKTLVAPVIDLSTVTSTGDVPVSDGGTGASTASAARTNLSVDIAGTDNSTDVSLAGTGSYISLAGQVITVDPITESDIADLGTLATMNTDIGSTVQAHSTVLDATTASFLTAQETKLGYIGITQAVDLDTMESRIASLSAAVVLKGTWDASVGTFPTSTTAGESWIVSVAGTVGGTAFVANDRIIATVNGASTTVYASNWHKLDYTDQVLSVAGRTGAVTLTVADLVGFTDNSTNWNTAFTWGNHALAGYAANTNVTNWDTAYGWGNHASAGYLTTLGLGGLSDATITTIAAGELLKWNGTGWINNTLVEAGIQASNARLSDISGITYAGGDLLYHNGTNLVKLPKGTAAQVLTMDGAGAVPTWAAASGGAPAGGYTTDISLLYLYTAENKGNRLNMVGGIMDPFADQTDVDTVASTGAWHVIGAYNRYGLGRPNIVTPMTAPTLSAQVASASSNLGANYEGWVAFDGDGTGYGWISASAALTGWLKIDLGYTAVAGGYNLYGVSAGGVSSAPKNWTFEGSANGTTWTVLDTRTNITGWVLGTSKSFTLAASANYRYYRINITLNNGNASFTGIAELEIVATVTTVDMSLQSNAFTAAATPTTARLGVQTTGAITINTDVIGYASRDGGTTWSTATLVLVDTLADGSAYYEDSAVSLAAQPVGTSMKYKIVYTNSTAATLSGVLLQWS